MWDNEYDMVAELLEEGCIIDYEANDDDDAMITWNMPMLEVKYPEVYQAVQEARLAEIDSHLNNMVDRGLLEMSFEETEDGLQPVYSLTEAGRAIAEKLQERS